MIFRYCPTILTVLCLAISCGSGEKISYADIPVIRELDSVLEDKAEYENYFLRRVEVMKGILAEQTDPGQMYSIRKKIAGEYSVYSLDSALTYLKANRATAAELDDDFKVQETDFLIAGRYIKAGYHLEAAEMLRNYDENSVLPELKAGYYSVMHDLSGELTAYASDQKMAEMQKRNREYFRERLYEAVAPKSFEWFSLKVEEFLQNEDVPGARACAMEMVDSCQPGTQQYAMACYWCQTAFPGDSLRPQRIYWLAKSAIADIMCATRDYASLNTLARELFLMGDVERAFRYAAEYCLPDAIFFNGKLRPWQVSQFFPSLQKEYQEREIRQKNVMLWMLAVVFFLSLVLLFLVFVLIKRQSILVDTRNRLRDSYRELSEKNKALTAVNGELSELNSKINEAATIKQEYIAQFLAILSDNIGKSRQYKNHVLKYIRMGKASEIQAEIESMPPIDDDINEFYKMFDSIFVNLFPGFVEKFNSLLVPGSEIIPKGDEILTPELRLFALIRLGITDSSRIASLLHYSSNTIYNYRAKIKNRALGDRSEFENAVKNIN